MLTLLDRTTITNDNGIEFQRDESLQEAMGVPIYFCDPESPWQRGSVENANGLIRQYLPKRTSIDANQPDLANAIEETLNFRPRAHARLSYAPRSLARPETPAHEG